MQINVIYYINKRKDNHTVISINAKKKNQFDRIQHLFMISLTKMDTEGMYLNLWKVIYDKPTANTILNSEKLKAFPLKSETR